jgi:putative transposase
MYRPRIEVSGAYYHVGARGNSKQPIFLGDDDRRTFLRCLARTARRHRWSILAYVLMTNHYHLVLQLEETGLSRGMCELNGGYALMFNSRHGRSNHVFGRRFWDEHIESDEHYAQACRYVVLNPVRAGIVRDVGDWPWSSYRATAGLEFAPAFLAVDELLSLFGPTPERARDAYIRFVLAGQDQRQPPGSPPPPATSASIRGQSRLRAA